MRVAILRDFKFTRTGADIHQAVANSFDDIPDDAVAGLEAEGYVSTKAEALPTVVAEQTGPSLVAIVRETDVPPTVHAPIYTTVEIPADWKSQKWFALKGLAEKIKGGTVEGADEAKSVIEAEVTKRAHKSTAAAKAVDSTSGLAARSK